MKNSLRRMIAALLMLALLLGCLPMSLAEEAAPELTAEPAATEQPESIEEPTAEPTTEPTAEPAPELTAKPTIEPTIEPTAEPIEEPTLDPSAESTLEPTVEPTVEPTLEPTEEPTAEPTAEPLPELTDEQKAALETIPEGFNVEAVAEAMLRSTSCPHTRLQFHEHVDYTSQNYTPIDLTWHSYSYRITGRTLECWECGKVFQTISINETVNEKWLHGWVIDKVSSKISVHCVYCDMTQKVASPCKHSGRYWWSGEDYNIHCSKCGAMTVLNTLQTYCSHSNRSVYYPNVAYTTYSRWNAQQHVKLSSIPIYDGYDDGIDGTCNDCGEWLVCNLDGSIDYYGNTDRISWESRDTYTLEPHSFRNGVCVCGYSLPSVSFSGHKDGDSVEAGSNLKLSWSCDGYSAFNVDAQLVSSPSSSYGERLSFTRSGNSLSLRVPEAVGRYICVRVQVQQSGTAATIEGRICLKIIDLNQLTLSGKQQLVAGKYTTLKAYDLAGKAISASKLAWRSSDKTIATVSSSGKVTAKKAGTITITATAKDGKYGMLIVTVLPKASGVAIYQNGEAAGKSITVDIGKTSTLKLSAVVAPEGAMQDVTWKSSSTKIAKVDASGNVSLRKTGTVTITATAKDGSGKKASVKLNVKNLVQSLKISGDLTLASGRNTTLKLTVAPSNASSKAVAWTSSDPSLASVSSKGKVTAKEVAYRRSVTITATAKDGSGVIAEHEILICPPATSVQLYLNGEAVKAANTAVGSPVQLRSLVYPTDASQAVKWSSSDKKVAKVDADGLITPIKAGSATITATTADGKKASLKLTVGKAIK